MLSKIDLCDFLEINQGLYNEPISPAQLALIQAMTQAFEHAAMNGRGSFRTGPGGDHDGSR